MTLGIPGIKITMSSVDQHEAMDSGMTLLQKLCENLHDCAWESLLSRLIPLQDTPSLIVPSTAVADVAYGSTVLHTIVWKAPKILANTFIELVPKNLEADKLFQMTDEDENTALHLCCSNLGPFHYPSSDRSETSVCDIGLSTLELLLNRSPNALTMQNKEGDTPLHLFVSCPAVTDIPPINSYFQRTESIQASLEAFSLIFDRLPNMEAAILKDITGATPLHTAIASSAENTFLMTLLNAAPFACKVEDLDGMIPLHYAASTPTISAEFMKELIRSYRFGLCHKTKNGDTPLHLAVRNLGSSDIDHDIPSSCPNTINLLKALMGHFLDDDNLPLTQISRGDLNKRYCPLLIMNQEKLNPIHCCALFNTDLSIIKVLVEHPHARQAIKMKNAFGSTPLHFAVAHPCVSQSIDIIKALSCLGGIDIKDNSLENCVHIAAKNIHCIPTLIQFLLMKNRRLVEQQNRRGKLPLHFAVQCQENEEVVKCVIEGFPMGLQVKCKLGNMPLHDAARCSASHSVVSMLLDEFPAALHYQNRNGVYPIHYAAEHSSPQIVQLLVDALPSSILFLNDKGQDPLDVAKRNKMSKEVVDILRSSLELWTSKASNGEGWGFSS